MAKADAADHGAAAARTQARAAAEELGLRMSLAGDYADAHLLLDTFTRIWGARHESEVMDLGTLVALVHSSNYVGLAHLDGRLIGGGVGFCGPPGEPFHSHVVGVLPMVVAKGVGRAIKLDQRAWCLEQGVTSMHWTYDPLVSRNAYFNIRKLGALPVAYYEDFYGEMNDGINSGQPSDRMMMRWDLTREIPAAPSAEAGPADAGPVDAGPVDAGPADDIPDVVSLTADDDAPTTFTAPPSGHGGVVLVGVPRDIESLRRRDPDLAGQWRMVTREAFGTLLDSGWSITDFRAGHYVLRRGTP